MEYWGAICGMFDVRAVFWYVEGCYFVLEGLILDFATASPYYVVN